MSTRCQSGVNSAPTWVVIKIGTKMDTGRNSEPGCSGEFGSCIMAVFMS